MRELLGGIYRKIIRKSKLCINNLGYPSEYFIHCYLLDRGKNLFNGIKSSILAFFDIKEVPYEEVRYHASSQQVLRDCSTVEYVNTITLCVRDGNGNLFDFRGMPLEFELEIR